MNRNGDLCKSHILKNGQKVILIEIRTENCYINFIECHTVWKSFYHT